LNLLEAISLPILIRTQTTTDYHRKRQNRKTGELILEKRAKLISALPIKSYTCMKNYQE
ncbi:hypothetical protein T07_1725, partial [Trichinella nelsoni]